jgi:predicted CxxxxCH...CXXCH cytochrome family protein
MSQLRIRPVLGLIFLVLLIIISGCSSSKNENSPFSGGSHPSGWLPAGHMISAQTNIDACVACHGSDLEGGISHVSCTSCHLGGATSVHPLDWSEAILTTHGPYVAANTTSGCANATCHGTNLDGISGSGPSCTSCHLGGVMSGHPSSWADPIALNHAAYVQANGTSGCANDNCHGSSLTGVTGSGPSCTSCHIGSATSVHPVSWGTGTQIALNHAPYVATNGNTSCQNNYCHGSTLAGITGSGPSCTSCHLGGATSVHPLDWSGAILTTHGPYVAANTTSGCATETCHGTSLSGVSGSGPSCTSCHIGGVMSGHPSSWPDPIALNHASYVQANGTSGCATTNCHGSSLTGVTGSGPSCTSCHIGSATSVHPVSWGTGTQIALNHAPYVTTNGSTSCQNNYCHGSTLAGVASSGPGCQSCHQNGVYPFTATGCTSCHGNPPSGIAPPNQAGAHNTVTGHFASQVSLPDGCATCHAGQGAGTESHFNGVVNVQLLTSVYSVTGSTAMYNYDGTCSNVSCHGGNITPIWNTGSIDVNNDCTACHSFCTEYNGYCSGRHDSHVNEQHIYCTECHDTDKVVMKHFTTLNTMVMEGPAAGTIADNVHYSGSSCTPSCHAQRDWLP